MMMYHDMRGESERGKEYKVARHGIKASRLTKATDTRALFRFLRISAFDKTLLS